MADTVVAELNEKIKKERMVLDGAMKLHVAQQQPAARTMLEISIKDSRQRIDFLENELRKLTVRRASQANLAVREGGTVSTPPVVLENSNSGNSNMDLLRYNSHDITTEKVRYRLREIMNKQELESRVRSGSENLINAMDGKADAKSKADLEAQVALSKAKEALLAKAKIRYSELYVPGAAEFEEDPSPAIDTTKKVSGRMKIRLSDALNITTKKSPKEEIIATVVVDGQIMHTTKPAKIKWDENVEFQVGRASEMEILIKEKDGRLLALFWFRLADLALDLDQKHGIDRPKNFEVQEGIYDLEPCGQIHLKLNFAPLERTGKDAQQKIFRRVEVQKVYPRNGHRYVARLFYQVMQCTVCMEFLGRNGYQCISCNNTIHTGCYHRQVTKCIPLDRMADIEDKNTGQLLKYKIPHRWDAVINFGASWCVHCGYVLPPAKKVLRCTECQKSCHKECSPMVPQFCGLDVKMMDVLVAAFEAHEQKLLQQEVAEMEKAAEPAVFTQNEINQQKEAMDIAPAIKPDVGTVMSVEDESRHGVVIEPNTSESASGPVAIPERKSFIGPDRKSVATTSTTPVTYTEEEILLRTVTLDDFNLIAVLGRGAFGKVMLASEKRSNKLYAIKALKKEFIVQNDDVKSVKLEKYILMETSKNHHPFLVNLHSTFDTPGRIYFVMEYVAGGDLMCHILEKRRFQQGRARFYAAEVLLAIQYFHQNNIVYRDLKLDNILLCADGHIKLADYGICKNNMPFGATTATFCGTPDYMAPEILLNRRYGLSVDWWSFGVFIYVMLVGNYPFHGDDETDILEAILADAIEYPQSLPKVTTNLLQSCMTKNPARRLGSSRDDAEEVKRHPYFMGVDWAALLRRECTPPFLPTITSAHDVSNFDKEFTSEPAVLTPITSMIAETDQKEFDDFDYMSDWAFKERSLLAKNNL